MLVKKGDDKAAALVGHAAAHHRRVSRVEQGDIGVCQRQVVLIHDLTLKVATGLMGAFHIDLAVWSHRHADGIETDHLADGVRNALVVDIGSHLEVLQVVEDENDAITVGLPLQILQRITHRHIVKPMRDMLSTHGHSDRAQRNQQYDAALDHWSCTASMMSLLPTRVILMDSKWLSISTTSSSVKEGFHL